MLVCMIGLGSFRLPLQGLAVFSSRSDVWTYFTLLLAVADAHMSDMLASGSSKWLAGHLQITSHTVTARAVKETSLEYWSVLSAMAQRPATEEEVGRLYIFREGPCATTDLSIPTVNPFTNWGIMTRI